MNRRGWVLVGVGVTLLILAGWLLLSSARGIASDWAYDMAGIRDAQGRGLDGSGVRVAIVDTGFDAGHPSLKGIELVAWSDMVNDEEIPYDDNGHGSHVSGILAGSGSTFAGRLQGLTLKGAAPGISLIAVKAIDAKGTGTSANVAAGINFAITNRADVICLSLGSDPQTLPFQTDEISNAVNDATNKGILVVAAAGNSGDEESDVADPATVPRVIAVGAVDEDGHVADFSAKGNDLQNYGGILGTGTRQPPNQKPEIVAPGVAIQSAWKDDGYARASGTSQAVPFVCGALALLLEYRPNLKSDNTGGLVDDVKEALKDSAETLGEQRTPHDPKAGYGLLRADRLLSEF